MPAPGAELLADPPVPAAQAKIGAATGAVADRAAGATPPRGLPPLRGSRDAAGAGTGQWRLPEDEDDFEQLSGDLAEDLLQDEAAPGDPPAGVRNGTGRTPLPAATGAVELPPPDAPLAAMKRGSAGRARHRKPEEDDEVFLEEVASLVVPVAAATPPAPRPKPNAPTLIGKPVEVPQDPPAVLPQGPVRRKPRPAVAERPTRRRQVGDLICGECGEPNTSSRKFCSRCGHSLSEAEVVRPRWWRRLLGWRKPKTHPAGTRPGRDGAPGSKERRGKVLGRVRVVLGFLGVVAMLAYTTVPFVHEGVDRRVYGARDYVERQLFPRYDPVHPTAIAAPNGEEPGHPATAAFDGYLDTYWAAPLSKEPLVVISFDTAENLAKVIVHSGDKADFVKLNRPRVLHLVYSTGQTEDVTLEDTPNPQTLTLEKGQGAKSVEIHVTEMYSAVGGTQLAVAEFEFFVRD